MSATYTRKGSYSLSTIRTLLSANSVFNSLADAVKNAIINAAVQKIATLRNSLGLNDYNFDTVAAGSVFMGDNAGYIDFTKYLRFVVIEAGESYKGTTYPSNTILTEETYGFGTNPTLQRTTEGSDVFINVTSSGEFSESCSVVPNNNSITWDGTNPDAIVVDVTDSPGVVMIEIYER